MAEAPLELVEPSSHPLSTISKSTGIAPLSDQQLRAGVPTAA